MTTTDPTAQDTSYKLHLSANDQEICDAIRTQEAKLRTLEPTDPLIYVIVAELDTLRRTLTDNKRSKASRTRQDARKRNEGT